MKAKFNFLMLVFLMIAVPVFAQNAKKITVTGKVTDEQGMPVIGAGVMVKGTTTGAATGPGAGWSQLGGNPRKSCKAE